jgi:tRNA A-37 threonylcarbamoyl transferase component Bud32
VPHCYGWYDFASELQDGEDATVLAKRHPSMSYIQEIEEPPRALLLEYLEDTEHLSAKHYNPEMAAVLLDALERIHSCGIIHMDTDTRNILVRPDGKTFWVKASYSSVFESLTMSADRL